MIIVNRGNLFLNILIVHSLQFINMQAGIRQLGPTEGGPAYVAVLNGRSHPQERSGPPKPAAKSFNISEPAASSEVAKRRKYLEDMSGPLGGMPAGKTPNAQVANTNVVPAGERLNKTPIYVSGVTDTRGVLIRLRVVSQPRSRGRD